jgi:hypothetical protein
MSWDISFHAFGDQFKPSLINYAFTESQDYNEMDTEPYGFAIIRAPDCISYSERIKYILDISQRLRPELEHAGATKFYVDIARYYYGQCNEEYTAEELSLMAQLKCSLHYSAYLVTEEEELRLEREL